jgi:hypothetical protein
MLAAIGQKAILELGSGSAGLFLLVCDVSRKVKLVFAIYQDALIVSGDPHVVVETNSGALECSQAELNSAPATLAPLGRLQGRWCRSLGRKDAAGVASGQSQN